jgi:hypothetical protein
MFVLLASAGAAMAAGTDGMLAIPGAPTPLSLGDRGSSTVLYDNTLTGAETGFNGTATPRNSIADDFDTLLSNVTIESMDFGIVTTHTSGTASFDIRVTFWEDADLLGAGNITGNKASFIIPVSGIGIGAFTTGILTLPVPVAYADGAGAVSFEFFNPGSTSVRYANATMFFDGTGVNTGFGDDVFWRDGAAGGDGLNGNYVGGEARFFGGAPNLANTYLQLNGVPAPSAVALLGLGGLVAGRRRRA